MAVRYFCVCCYKDLLISGIVHVMRSFNLRWAEQLENGS